ncbi:IclR family transcriptional regulator [Natrialbaceae archaeon A-CW2]
MNAESTRIKSLGTTIRIVEELIDRNGAGVAELATQLALPKSTVHDHLKTLEYYRLVENSDGVYNASLHFLDYGGDIRRKIDCYPAGWPEVQKLAIDTGEHANLMIEESGIGRYIYISEGETAAQLDTYTGMSAPLHVTSMGKAILAQLPNCRVQEILEEHGTDRFTKNTITDEDELYQELEDIRNRGYAIDDEERVLGVRSVGAAIIDNNDTVHGAISVSGPVSRFTGERFREEIPDAVLQSANIIQLNIMYG